MKKIILFLFRLTNRYYLQKYTIKIPNNWKINGIVFVRNWGEMTIGNHFKCTSSKIFNPIGGDTVCRFVCLKGASINIGNNVGISNSTFFAKESITIGNDVKIGGSCKFYDNDFHSLHPEIRKSEKASDIKSAPILIKDNAFIGTGSIILKGVTIGINSVIGAGSVVTKSIPDNEIWAGNPAKKIKDILI